MNTAGCSRIRPCWPASKASQMMLRSGLVAVQRRDIVEKGDQSNADHHCKEQISHHCHLLGF